MATKLNSKNLDMYNLDKEETLWLYNGLDCAITYELYDMLKPQLQPATSGRTYNFTRAMLGPAMSMMTTGLRVDWIAVLKALEGDPDATEIKEQKGLFERHLDLGGMKKKKGKWVIENEDALFQRLAKNISGDVVNFHSPLQLQKFFYETLSIAPITTFKQGKHRVTTDREALEKVVEKYPRGEVAARCLLRLRDIESTIDILEKDLDDDGRFRCSFNVVGTETGRWASRKSAFNRGTNLQNITKELRHIFIPDDGYVMFEADLEQAESRVVAYLSGDQAYIDACEGGDLHADVAQMVFSLQPNQVHNTYYRQFTYRDMAKRAGHGTNYRLTPRSLANHMHIQVKQAYDFNLRYLGGGMIYEDAERMKLTGIPHDREGDVCIFPGAFPGIRHWHEDVDMALMDEGSLVTAFGRERMFWERPEDPATQREATAYEPQSTVSDLTCLGIWKIWDKYEGNAINVLANGHDAVMGQVREDKVVEMNEAIPRLMENPLTYSGRKMLIPVEIGFGPNWRDVKCLEL